MELGLPHTRPAANRITSMLNGLGFIRHKTNSQNVQARLTELISKEFKESFKCKLQITEILVFGIWISQKIFILYLVGFVICIFGLCKYQTA